MQQLISFSVSNYKSIKNEATLSFAADQRDPSHSSILIEKEQQGSLLPTIALFGANGSGKSNLLSAMTYLKRKYEKLFLIIKKKQKEAKKTAFKESIPDDYWSDIPVFIGENGLLTDTPTTFRFSLIDDHLPAPIYEYSVSIFHNRIWEETLYKKKPSDQAYSLVFSRKLDSIEIANKGIDNYSPDLEIESNNNYYKKVNPLLPCVITELSTINYCRRVYIFLTDLIDYGSVIYNHKWVSEITRSRKENIKELTKIKKAINNHTNNKESYYITQSEVHKSKLLDIDSDAKNMVLFFNYFGCPIIDFRFPEKKGDEIKFIYKNKTINLSEESTGNRKLLGIVFMLLRCFKYGGTLIFDEIESGLHEIIAFKLLDLMNHISEYLAREEHRFKMSHMYNSFIFEYRFYPQLVFSTHNTNLLDPNLLRKDQIWFSQKDEEGASEFYSLSDYPDVRIVDDFQRNYLRGLYDSIPVSDVDVETVISALQDSNVLL